MSHFRNQVIMTHLFPVFHNPDYTCLFVSFKFTSTESSTDLDLVPPLLVDLLLSLFPLLARFDFTSHLHDLDLGKGTSERLVECENIVRADFSSFGHLGQDSELATC